MRDDVVRGSVLIALGACCYGMLGVYVKRAYSDGFNVAEVTIAQFGLGLLGLSFLALFLRGRSAGGTSKVSMLKLTLAGSSLGFTSVFYYMSVRYIAVSVAIVFLAQSVWMGVLVEAFVCKRMPTMGKMLSAALIMIGTILATNIFNENTTLNWKGVVFGLSGAVCYTATMFSTNHLEVRFPPLQRSLFMVLGGLLVVCLVFHGSFGAGCSGRIFIGWGVVIALFGTILPPLLFTRGMPLAGMGFGAIMASIEIPIAVIMANVFLGERVSITQWMGVTIILTAVAMINFRKS